MSILRFLVLASFTVILLLRFEDTVAFIKIGGSVGSLWDRNVGKPAKEIIKKIEKAPVAKTVEKMGTEAGKVIRGGANLATGVIDPLVKNCGEDICKAIKHGRKKLTGEDKLDRAKKVHARAQEGLLDAKNKLAKVNAQLELKKAKYQLTQNKAEEVNSLVKERLLDMNKLIDSQIENLLIIRQKVELRKRQYLKLRNLYKDQEFEKNSFEAFILSFKVFNAVKKIIDEKFYGESEPLVYEYNLALKKYDFLNLANMSVFAGVKDSISSDGNRVEVTIGSLKDQIKEIDDQVKKIKELKRKNEWMLNNKSEVR